MRPSAPGAGRLRRGTALFAAAVAIMAAGCVAAGSAAPARTDATEHAVPLTPQGVIVGGFSAAPARLPGQAIANGPYIKLMFPAAIAANGADLYVADIGRRTLLRIDTLTQAVSRLREVPALPGVHLETERDGSVYVVSPGQPSIERVARDGRRLGLFAEKFGVLQPADVTVGPDGRLWLSDAAGGVFAFHPSGRMERPLVGRGDGFRDEFGGATLLAAGRDSVLGYDPVCRCVQVFDRDGAPIGRFGEGELLNPVDLAIDHYDRAWIVDQGDRLLKIYADWRLVARVSPARLGLTDITGLSLDVDLAYLADGPGGKIGIFAISPPPPK